jgi:hypothetical protein
MARNRVIYKSEALYISDNSSSITAAKHQQLHRVQSANYSFNIARTDINQYGQAGALDTIVLEAPTVSADISYYLADGLNEQALGLTQNAGSGDSFKTGFLSNVLGEGSGKNLYIITHSDSNDAVENATSLGLTNGAGGRGLSAIGIGNAYLTDYSMDASVGSIPTVSVSFEALNIRATTGISGGAAGGLTGDMSPAINRQDGTVLGPGDVALANASTGAFAVTAFRPGDISLSFGTITGDAERQPLANIAGTSNEASSHVQSVSLSFSIPRSPIERLGSKYAFARPADFPINATFDVSAIVNEVESSNLASMIDDEGGTEILLKFRDPGTTTDKAAFKLKNAKLVSESFSSSIGSNKTVDLSFQVSIGGSGDQNNNVYFSGTNETVPFA